MRTTIKAIQEFKDRGECFPVLTAYDYYTACAIDESGVPAILVGDSLGNVVLGYDSTVSVTMDDMIHHTAAVARGTRSALVIADMPFMSYQTSPQDALRNAARFLQEAGAQSVKLEGGEVMAETIKALVDRGIPVMGHIGFTPQSEFQIGRRFQGRRSVEDARKMIRDAEAVQDAGAYSIVLELVPEQLSQIITERLSIPTIGIGSGPHCDAQVQVVSDMLGIVSDHVGRHVKRYADLSDTIRAAVNEYAQEVRDGTFPTSEHTRPLSQDILKDL